MTGKDKTIKQLESRIKELEENLHTGETSFRNVVEWNQECILILDAAGCVVYANPAALQLFGMKIVDLLGKPVGIPIEVTRGIEIDIVNEAGDKINVEVSVVKIDWEGSEAYLSMLRDVSKREKTEAALVYMSRHDELTGLPNRHVLDDVLRRTIKQSFRHQLHSALLFLDLDHFKEVNDSLGYDVGDILLKRISIMLQSIVREHDLVVRLGSDEFAVILGLVKAPSDAATVAQKIIDALSEPINIEDHEVNTGVSIGIAMYPHAGKNTETLIKSADSAMYMAKQAGCGQYKYFTSDVDKTVKREVQIEAEIIAAIDDSEFYMVYQPFIDLKSDRVIGIESLLRWRNKTLGEISVSEFFPIAEKLNLMNTIGCLTLTHACDEYLSHSIHDLLLSVNMSMTQLSDDHFIKCVMERIQRDGMKPKNLSLEITESDIMMNPKESIKKLTILSEAGVRLLIDDYGTGHSSLAYLQKLPVNILKIDQSFLKNIENNTHNALIVNSTIALAHSLGLKTIAEGVETKVQEEFLKQYGCDYAQGFYYSKPVDMEVIKQQYC